MEFFDTQLIKSSYFVCHCILFLSFFLFFFPDFLSILHFYYGRRVKFWRKVLSQLRMSSFERAINRLSDLNSLEYIV